MEIPRFVEYYNHGRYHRSLNDLKPVYVYKGREIRFRIGEKRPSRGRFNKGIG